MANCFHADCTVTDGDIADALFDDAELPRQGLPAGAGPQAGARTMSVRLVPMTQEAKRLGYRLSAAHLKQMLGKHLLRLAQADAAGDQRAIRNAGRRCDIYQDALDLRIHLDSKRRQP